MRHTCVVLVDRANYGRLQSVMEAVRAHPSLRLSVICGGSTVLQRFFTGPTLAEQLTSQGYDVTPLWHEQEGNLPLTQAKSLGDGCREYATALHRIVPDVVLLIGDRFEALGAAAACVTLGIPLVHFQGGEVSSSLDERYRHAVSKLADFHVPATKRAAENLVRMGEREESVLTVGCPSSDSAKTTFWRNTDSLLCVYHPDTAIPGNEQRDMETVLDALDRLDNPSIVHWPNIDAGSDGISKALRRTTRFETVKNLPPGEFLKSLAGAACCVGNSSSFVRDSSYFGTPVVLVGHRQDGRECGPNVVRCECETDAIIGCVLGQLDQGRYPPSDLYGDGHVSERVVEKLLTLPLRTVKRLAYDLEAVLT